MLRPRQIKRYEMNNLYYYLNLFRALHLKKITLRKFINILHTVFEWKTKKVFVKSKPFAFRLEPSAICNLKCPACPTPKKVFKPGQVKIMSLVNFQSIYEKISKYACRMTFYMEGEPMTNPYLLDMVKMASKSRIFTSFCTNSTLRREQLLKPLFDSKLDFISIALDGYTQESYQKYRINGDVMKVKNGIKMVMEHKREHGYSHPFVNVYTILFDHVLPEVDMIKSFCEGVKVDRLTFRPDESNQYGTYEYAGRNKRLPTSKCFWPWVSISIDTDGSVYPCPVAFERPDRQPYGNLLENSLDEIWNSELYINTRKYLTEKEKDDCMPVRNLPCSNCRWYGKNDSKKADFSVRHPKRPSKRASG
jgi:radical SAM protein with 4Fe4S-binding SPASM domain